MMIVMMIVMIGRNGQDDPGICWLAGRHDLRLQRELSDGEGPPPDQEQPRHHPGLGQGCLHWAGGPGDTAR